ncbi:MAG: DDE-type integrase/transposase/recombinase [Nitrososphaeria archaeon]
MRLSLRELRGLGIVAAGGQIQRVTNTKFFVKSQKGDKDYIVEWKSGKWTCDCEDYAKRVKPCKHIFAVNFLLNLPTILLLNYKAFERRCPYCGSSRTILKGFRYNKSGAVRLRRCKDCNKWFKDAAAFTEHKGNNTLLAVISLDLFYKGLSLRAIRDHLRQIYNINKSVSTIHRWVLKLTSLLRRASQKLKVEVGDRWLADETIVKVNGEERYIWNMLDYETRFHIVSLVMEGRGAKEALNVLVEAVKRSRKIPNELVTDGLKSYNVALKMLNLPVKHISNVSIADKANNNNRIERLHETLKSWIKNKRGLKNHFQEVIEAYRVYYNYIRPHSGLKNVPPVNEHEGKWLNILLEEGKAK